MNTSPIHSTSKITPVLVAGLMLVTATASWALAPAGPDFDAITSAIVDHATQMSAIGPHPVGTAGETKSAEYIRQAFQAAGLITTVESFRYQRFVLEKIDCTIGDTSIPVQLVGLDPYGGDRSFSGDVVFLDPSDEDQQYRNRVVVMPGERAFFGVMFQGADMIVCLDPETFEKVANRGRTDCNLTVTGHMETRTSHNVVGTLAATTPTDREILVTSHLDGYRDSPGANDNGTGVGSCIELARTFKKLPVRSRNLTFLAFGGEEVGLLGSRAYFQAHQQSLANLDLVFNVDTIGGTGDPRVEMGGGTAEDYAERGACHFPEHLMDAAWEGADGKWRVCHPDILQPLLMSSQSPAWLDAILQETVNAMDFKVDAARTIFSDGRMFAQGGVPVSGIAQEAGSKLIHSQNDTPENLHPELIRKCMRITCGTLSAALTHFEN